MAKEKNITDLKAEHKELIARAKSTVEKAKAEGRSLTADEEKFITDSKLEARTLELEIMGRETALMATGVAHRSAEEKFSLVRALRSLVNGTAPTGVEADVCARAKEVHSIAGVSFEDKGIMIPAFVEGRAAYTAATESATGVVIDQVQQELLLPLEPNLVLSRLGARMMSGLRGDIYWPSHSGVNVFWEGENTAAKDGAGQFSKGKVFKPVRLTAYVDISDQLLTQENRDVEALIRQLFAQAIAQKLEATAMAATNENTYAPDGIFKGYEGAVSGDMSWANIVKFEQLADTNNALLGKLGYLMHPALLYKAKTKVKDTSGAGGFVYGNDGVGIMNGYTALRSNHVPSGLGESTDEYGIVFGNWNDYFIGQWGSYQVKVDPYTQSLNGVTRLIVTGYFNMGIIRPESFVIGSLK